MSICRMNNIKNIARSSNDVYIYTDFAYVHD